MASTYGTEDEFTLKEIQTSVTELSFDYDLLIDKKNNLVTAKNRSVQSFDTQIAEIDERIAEADALGLQSLKGFKEGGVPVSLTQWATNKCNIVSDACNAYIQKSYSVQNQVIHMKIMSDALAIGRMDVYSYVNQIWTWGMNAIMYYHAAKAQILAICEDITKTNSDIYNEVMAVLSSFDMSQFDSADPKVDILVAIRMLQPAVDPEPVIDPATEDLV